MDINVLTIINPTSGKGKIEQKIDEIKQNIEEQGMQNEIILTQKEKNRPKNSFLKCLRRNKHMRKELHKSKK